MPSNVRCINNKIHARKLKQTTYLNSPIQRYSRETRFKIKRMKLCNIVLALLYYLRTKVKTFPKISLESLISLVINPILTHTLTCVQTCSKS